MQVALNRIEHIESMVVSLKSEQKAQQTEIESLKGALSSSLHSAEILSEVEQRQYRLNNIIVFGLPERKSGSIDEKKEHDEVKMDGIFSFLDVEDVDIVSCNRLGKPRKDGNRILRVRISCGEKKKAILRKSRNLKGSRFDGIFLSNDFTPYQQEERRNLREELKRRKNLGEDVFIYRGKVQEKSTDGNFRR